MNAARTSFELRTTHNKPALAFDNEHRAREEWAKVRSRGWKLVKVTRVEEDVI